jgi:hypothetical protein
MFFGLRYGFMAVELTSLSDFSNFDDNFTFSIFFPNICFVSVSILALCAPMTPGAPSLKPNPVIPFVDVPKLDLNNFGGGHHSRNHFISSNLENVNGHFDYSICFGMKTAYINKNNNSSTTAARSSCNFAR